jgi:YbbR domain-containing protein
MDWLFEHDTALKILAVLVAVAVWVQVNTSTPQPVEHGVAAVVSWTPPVSPALHVVTPRPADVTVEIRGTPSAVSSVGVAAYVNLNKIARPGTYTLPVSATVPAGTSLVSVTPSTVTVTVVQYASKSFAVKLETSGTLASGYGVQSMSLPNPHALVKGPIAAVKKVAAVVARLPLSGQTSSFSSQAALVAVNRDGVPVKGVTVSPSSRLADVTVSPEKIVPVTVKYTGQPAAGFSVGTISVSPLHVTLFGPASVLGSIVAVYTTPVDIAGATGPVTATPVLKLPTGVTASVPSTVTVTIAVQ